MSCFKVNLKENINICGYGKSYVEQTPMTKIWELLLYSLFLLHQQGLARIPGDYCILGGFDQDTQPLSALVLFSWKRNSLNQSKYLYVS